MQLSRCAGPLTRLLVWTLELITFSIQVLISSSVTVPARYPYLLARYPYFCSVKMDKTS